MRALRPTKACTQTPRQTTREKLLVFTPAAHADLAAIWHYTAEHWGVNQAEHYVDDIQSACHALATGKRLGKPVDVRLGYLKYLVGSHVIYFRDQNECLDVVRILHSKMDAERHL